MDLGTKFLLALTNFLITRVIFAAMDPKSSARVPVAGVVLLEDQPDLDEPEAGPA